MTFGERLVQLRKEKGFTREAFADYLEISKYTLRNYEMDTHEPNSDFLKRLSKIFDVSIDYLLCVTDEKEKILPYQLKSSEFEHIKKYRALDDHGKKCVNSVLEWETQRMQMFTNMQKQLIDKDSRIKELEITTLPTRIISYYQKLASAGSGEYLFDEIPCDNIVVPENSLSEQADFVIGVNGHSMEPTYSDGDKVYVEISEKIPTGSIGIFTRGSDCFIKELGKDRLISHNSDKENYPDIPASDDIRCVGLVLGKVEEVPIS